MSLFVSKLGAGLREFGNDINANISKALNINKVPESPNELLLEQVRAGRIQGLETVLDELSDSIDINGALDADFRSALCLACLGGHEDAALLLLHRAGADPNNAAGVNAAAANAVAIATAISPPTLQGSFGAYGSPSSCSPCGDHLPDFFPAGRGAAALPPTPLMLAIEAGLERVVLELLSRGARVDARRAGDGWTALHLCARRGDAATMEALVGAPLADPGARTSRLETPLSVACAAGHLSVVDLLLGDEGSAGAATKGEDDCGDGGGGSCGGGSRRGSRGARRHAEEKMWDGRAPLHRAAANGHAAVVHRLLAHGVASDPVDKNGATPLILASRRGHWNAVRQLILRGEASVVASTVEGDTPLHAGAWAGVDVHGAERVLKLLLRSGADVNALNYRGSSALHLASAAGASESVRVLLAAGANVVMTNMCGLSPGSCFLRPSGCNVMEHEAKMYIRRLLRERRGRLGRVRRLADSSAKRAAVSEVTDRASAAVHRFVEFALKTQRWDLDAREHRKRLRRLDQFRIRVLSDPARPNAVAVAGNHRDGGGGGSSSGGQGGDLVPPEPDAPTWPSTPPPQPPPLLLDLSPDREVRAARAVKQRRAAAAEAIRGARLALQDLADWKEAVLAEREEVAAFLREMDPALAFASGPSCIAGEGGEASRKGDDGGMIWCEVDVAVADRSFLAIEARDCGIGVGASGSLGRHASWTGGGELGRSGPPGASESFSGGGGWGRGGGGSRGRAEPAGFMRALAALNPCVAALRDARSAVRSKDRLGGALETLREHVKSTLIDLMDLETSIPGGDGSSDEGKDNDEEEGEEENGEDDGDDDGDSGESTALVAVAPSLDSVDAAALDVKIAGVLARLGGPDDRDGSRGSVSSGDGSNCSSTGDGDGDGDAAGIAKVSARADRPLPRSLANVYRETLGEAAAAAELEVDKAESLTAIAVRMVIGAAAGPLLWALDDAYQRLAKGGLELGQLLPEAEVLLEGSDSAEEMAREARSRLVTARQQVVDEEDLLEELVSKLRRRRRQAAGAEEIGIIEDERLHVRARLAALRSVKLSELKALRHAGAYRIFPELLLEHPNRAENAFRSLLLSGIAVRDVDEWEEHHMTSVASTGGGGGERALDGFGGERCRLAEVDGSAVAIVEVDCRDPEAERALVATLLRFSPPSRRQSTGGGGSGGREPASPLPPRRPPPELATVTGISLRGERALLEVPVEGAITAKAWLAASAVGGVCAAAMAEGGGSGEGEPPNGIRRLAIVAGITDPKETLKVGGRGGGGSVGTAAACSVPSAAAPSEETAKARQSRPPVPEEVWAVMLQALRGLAAVHAMSEESTHGAVCLSNILVAARPTTPKSAGGASASATATATAPATAGNKDRDGSGGAASSAVTVARTVDGVHYTVSPERSPLGTLQPSPTPPMVATATTPTLRGGGSFFRRARLAPPAPGAPARAPTACLAPEVVRGQPPRQPADVFAFGVALRAAYCGGMEEACLHGGGGGSGGRGADGGVLPVGRGPPAGLFRQALSEVLERMLEEDVSRRCTALEALESDYFRVPPSSAPDPIYPHSWSPFPVKTRRASSTAPGGQPHWVAVALAAGRKDDGDNERTWLGSCYAVDVIHPRGGFGDGSGGGGGGGKGERVATAAERESAEIEALLRRSMPGARLHRLVRLQDRGRWLRYACERDAATAAATATTSATAAATPTVSRLFADPREVLSREALAAIRAPACPTSLAGKTGGRTIAATSPPSSFASSSVGEEEEEEAVAASAAAFATSVVAAGVAGRLGSGAGAAGVRARRGVKCTETARFATVAFAIPPGGEDGQGGPGAGVGAGSDGGSNTSNTRTLVVISAVTGPYVEQLAPEETLAKLPPLPPPQPPRLPTALSARGGEAIAATTTAAAASGIVAEEPAAAGASTSTSTMASASTGLMQNGDDGDDGGSDDPFLGVEPAIDDLTRVDGIGITASRGASGRRASSLTNAGVVGAAAVPRVPGAGSGIGSHRDFLPVAADLSSPAVNAVKSLETLRGSVDGPGPVDGCRGGAGGATAEVFTVRREACYPEYLVTFSLPPHAV